MEQVSLTLKQMAQALNCSERTLYRRCRERPETVPPFIHGRRYTEWQFAFPAYQAWLEKRAHLRAAYSAPHLRWCEAPRRNPDAAKQLSLHRAIRTVAPNLEREGV
jgi:hypothetical protein